ncbi:hypothetical protein LJR044_003467 [Microbacterium foliorum]|jgi:hypothetical protein|uniref:hypothetical protein n=1 Tax=Microbacterium TaxID=33882 RepID=UPI0005ABCF93|nr:MULTISPECIES: hypothetical protein [Microbacterium]AQY02963.1 hypothetical protein B2G67_16975 [Microbacterium foliorum]KIP95152.1 hypothetical protein RU09_01600 [Microbacterium sp. MEJ108Y]KQR48266.1 hypothetical protein ASF87_04955 [Microbacterium sp. Leaf161]
MDLSDPQAWTMIGIFASAMLGGMTLMTTQFSRVLRAEIGGLRGELGGEIVGLRSELGGEIGGLRGELRGEIDVLRTEMRAGFEVMNVRLDSLDTRLTRVEGKVDDLDTELTHLATRFWRSQ